MDIRIRQDQRGVVGFNLVLTIAFALFAVIELSRVVLAASQIDDRVKVIDSEIGPGSNVARLDETKKLDQTGQMAEDILAAAQPLAGQAQQIVDTARSIDGTVDKINANAREINGTVRSIDATVASLLPVVRNINGDGVNAVTGGVAYTNTRAQATLAVVGAIQSDLGRTKVLGTLVSVDRHAVAICNGSAITLLAGATCSAAVAATGP